MDRCAAGSIAREPIAEHLLDDPIFGDARELAEGAHALTSGVQPPLDDNTDGKRLLTNECDLRVEVDRRAVDEDPAHVPANMILGDVLARRHALGQGSEELLAEARAAYDRALARDPSDLATLLARARLELSVGEDGAARWAQVEAAFAGL